MIKIFIVIFALNPVSLMSQIVDPVSEIFFNVNFKSGSSTEVVRKFESNKDLILEGIVESWSATNSIISGGTNERKSYKFIFSRLPFSNFKADSGLIQLDIIGNKTLTVDWSVSFKDYNTAKSYWTILIATFQGESCKFQIEEDSLLEGEFASFVLIKEGILKLKKISFAFAKSRVSGMYEIHFGIGNEIL